MPFLLIKLTLSIMPKKIKQNLRTVALNPDHDTMINDIKKHYKKSSIVLNTSGVIRHAIEKLHVTMVSLNKRQEARKRKTTELSL